MGSYLKALKKIERTSLSKRREIEKFISEWEDKNGGLGIYIVPNIEREFFLHEDRMVRILDTIHQYRILIISKLEGRYLNECHNHVRQGGEIKISYPTIVGRAVTRAGFTQDLKDRYNLKKYEAESIVHKLVSGNRLSDDEKDCHMSEHSAWVTWNKKHLSRYPFHFARSPHRGQKIRANLGLDRKKSRGDLLLLVYYTRPSNKLFIPTIADAGLYEFFQVAGKDRYYGGTRPWHKSDLDDKVKQKPQSRPEAVHEPEELSQIKYVKLA